jgi:hypothetical protein
VKILRSYRWRRRLLFTVVPIAIAAPLIYLGVHLSTPGNPGNANGPTVPNYKAPTPARFTKAKQRAVRGVLASFIRSAVAREDPARSWDLAAPSLKEGVTRKEWNRGDLPVVPYPALHKGLGQWDYVEYSYKNSVGLEVFLFPKPGSGYSALTADVELVRSRNGQWLVDYWMPKKFHGPPALAKSGGKSKKITRKAAGKRSHAPNKAKAAPPPAATDDYRSPQASHWYWVIPIAILSLIIIVPVGLGVVHWRRNRKAAREYEDWQASRARSRDAA